MKCQYCASHLTHVVHHNERHKVDKSFGPFDLFECRSCGSLGTAEPPSPERLAQFYRGYDEFRPQWYNAAAAEGALAAQYNFYARFLARYVSARQSWVDIGAGHGEVANLLSQIRAHAPGQAIDIGDRPPALASEVGYDSIDLNAPDWVTAVGRQFDCVFSVAVWEHVLSPADFAREALSLVAPGGRLTLICPDYGSLARRALNRSWPYFEPGEHISIPTRAGAKACLEKACANLGLHDARIRAAPLNVGYSLRYLFNVLRLRPLAALIPPGLSTPLPTGILAATVERA